MSTTLLVIGPDHTLRDAARRMAGRHVGAAVVDDHDGAGHGIITERDILESVAAGQDPDTELVRDHVTVDAVTAAPDWPLEQAADTMVRAGFRHLVIVDGATVLGILSMRDIVRVWAATAAPV